MSGVNPIDNTSKQEASFPGVEHLTNQGVIFGANPLSNTSTDTNPAPNQGFDSRPHAQYQPLSGMSSESGLGGSYVANEHTEINDATLDLPSAGMGHNQAPGSTGALFGANPLSGTSVDTNPAPKPWSPPVKDKEDTSGMFVTNERTVINKPAGHDAQILDAEQESTRVEPGEPPLTLSLSPRRADKGNLRSVPAPAATGPSMASTTPFDEALNFRSMTDKDLPPAPASPSFIQADPTRPAAQEALGPIAALGAASYASESFGKAQAHQTSLPSTEKDGAQEGELSGGAGALPGKSSEEAVAVLPDEHSTGAAAATPDTAKDESRKEEAPEQKKDQAPEQKEKAPEQKKEQAQEQPKEDKKPLGDPNKPGTKGAPNKVRSLPILLIHLGLEHLLCLLCSRFALGSLHASSVRLHPIRMGRGMGRRTGRARIWTSCIRI